MIVSRQDMVTCARIGFSMGLVATAFGAVTQQSTVQCFAWGVSLGMTAYLVDQIANGTFPAKGPIFPVTIAAIILREVSFIPTPSRDELFVLVFCGLYAINSLIKSHPHLLSSQ